MFTPTLSLRLHTHTRSEWDGDWSHTETQDEYLDRTWDGSDLDLLPRPSGNTIGTIEDIVTGDNNSLVGTLLRQFWEQGWRVGGRMLRAHAVFSVCLCVSAWMCRVKLDALYLVQVTVAVVAVVAGIGVWFKMSGNGGANKKGKKKKKPRNKKKKN